VNDTGDDRPRLSFSRPTICNEEDIMAHKKGQGSSKNGRDSNSQRLGIKVYGGGPVQTGSIIIRQRGTRFHPGAGAGRGGDDTIFATVSGTVQFGEKRGKRVISVVAFEAVAAA